MIDELPATIKIGNKLCYVHVSSIPPVEGYSYMAWYSSINNRIAHNYYEHGLSAADAVNKLRSTINLLKLV